MSKTEELSDYSQHFAELDSDYIRGAREQLERPFEHFRTRHDLEILRRYLKPDDVLDFPIGTARVYPHLKEEFTIFGKDIAPPYVELAKVENPEIAERFAIGSFENPRETRQFDSIYSLRVVNNVQNFEMTVANIAALLKPGGVWLFNLPPARADADRLSELLGQHGLILKAREDYDWISSVKSMGRLEQALRSRILAGIANGFIPYWLYRLIDRVMTRKGLAMIVAQKPVG